LPATGAVFGRPGNPRSHYLYVLTDPPGKSVIKHVAARDDTLIELRLGATDKGVQTVFPGSQHPSGELIEWETEGEPASIPSSALELPLGRCSSAAGRTEPATRLRYA
jgi:hypothetical protein